MSSSVEKLFNAPSFIFLRDGLYFGIGLSNNLPVLETCELIKLAEAQEIDYAWIADESPSPPYRDVFVAITSASLNTNKIKIGTGVCNPYTRHPAMLAVAVASLNEIAGSRIILGLGPGGSLSLAPLGMRMWYKPIRAIKESFKIIRGMFEGNKVNIEGELFKAINCKLGIDLKRKPQIYLAARGPQMLEIAGELADGVLLTAPLESIKFAIDMMKLGAEKSNRSVGEIDIANWLPFAVSEDAERARETVKRAVAVIVANSPEFVFENTNIKLKEVTEVRDALKEGVASAMKKVTSEMMEKFSVAGPPKDCLQIIKKFRDVGVSQIVLSLIGPNQKDTIKIIGEKIIPCLKF